MSDPVRVLVVDDSALMRKMIPQIIERDTGIQVVGTAMDGEFAIKKMDELKPDVVTLDLDMPRMDGMETLRLIVRNHKVPVIIVSAHTTQGASATFKALASGAFDFVAKPKDAASAHMEDISKELIGKIKVASQSGVSPATNPATVLSEPKRAAKPAAKPKRAPSKRISRAGMDSTR